MSAKIHPTLDEYFMGIVQQVTKGQPGPGASVGAVIERERRLLTTGDDGAPEGWLTAWRLAASSKTTNA